MIKIPKLSELSNTRKNNLQWSYISNEKMILDLYKEQLIVLTPENTYVIIEPLFFK